MTATAIPVFDFSVRDSTEDDRRFIVETTAKVRMPHGAIWTEYKETALPAATKAFNEGTSRVAEAEGVLVGFILWDGEALSMLYVKREFRGVGIGLALLGAMKGPVEVTKPTPSWRQWTRRRGIRWQERR